MEEDCKKIKCYYCHDNNSDGNNSDGNNSDGNNSDDNILYNDNSDDNKFVNNNSECDCNKCNITASAVAVGEAFLSPEYCNIRVTSSATASAEGCTLEEAEQKALEVAQNVANSVAQNDANIIT